jgi:S1-C subfamily serine protease
MPRRLPMARFSRNLGHILTGFELIGRKEAICLYSKELIQVSSRLSSLARRAAAGRLMALLIVAPAAFASWAAAARPAPDSFADLADKLLPSVVNVSTTQTVKSDRGREHAGPEIPQFPPGSPFEEFFRDFFDHGMPKSGRPEAQPRKATSLGSGFIIDPAGYVVTNNHVIADADEITVILHDDTNLKAEVVGRDTKTDIALLKVKTDKPLAAVIWGDSDVARVGDWVLAIGNPFGLGGSVTAGILSASTQRSSRPPAARSGSASRSRLPSPRRSSPSWRARAITPCIVAGSGCVSRGSPTRLPRASGSTKRAAR